MRQGQRLRAGPYFYSQREQPIAKEFRINEQIRAREIRLIGENGEQLGVVSSMQALNMARDRGLDLVEVAPNVQPPVCRILDYGRYKYEQTKREREAKRHQKNVELKEVRLRPKIDEHDVAFKTKQAQRFLEDGDKVKITVMFRGREVTHPQLGKALLNRVAGSLVSVAAVEKPPAMEGRNMTLILAPALQKSTKDGAAKEGAAKEREVKAAPGPNEGKEA